MQAKRVQANVRDMTTGDPIKLILAFAIPLFIGNIFQQFYNMVDTMVVGHHLGDQAIAAIGATASLYSLVVNFAGGLNNGYGIVVTQCFGSHNKKDMKHAIAGMMLLDILVSIFLSLLALCFLPQLMRFMNTPASVFDQAHRYISIIYGGLTATICYNMFAAILRAMGNSKSPLYFLILSSLLNIALDVLLVMVFDMGVGGAAVATVLAQCVCAISCGIYTYRNYREYLPEKEDFKIPGTTFKSLFSMGISMALMSCVIDLSNVTLQRVNNLLGETIITAHAAARKLLITMIQPLATLSVANSTFTGQNWGAKNYARIQSTLKKVLLLEIGWGVFAASIIYLFGDALIRITTGTSDQEIIRYAVMDLRIHFSTFPVLGVLFCVRNALQAMGQKIVPVLSSCIELAMKIFSASILIPRLGFLGTCITEPTAWCLMTSFLMIYYFCNRKKLFAQA